MNHVFFTRLTWRQPQIIVQKNMLFEDSMSDVDESAIESESSSERGPHSFIYEDEDRHDPFESPNDDDILFFRLLFNSIIW